MSPYFLRRRPTWARVGFWIGVVAVLAALLAVVLIVQRT